MGGGEGAETGDEKKKWAERKKPENTKEVGYLGEAESYGWGATKPRKEPLFKWREDGRRERRRLLRAGRSEVGGRRSEVGGRWIRRRAERKLEEDGAA